MWPMIGFNVADRTVGGCVHGAPGGSGIVANLIPVDTALSVSCSPVSLRTRTDRRQTFPAPKSRLRRRR